MKNYTLNRIGIVGFCIMLFTSAFALPAMAQSNDNVDVTSIAKVTTFNHLTVIPAAGATLMRSNYSVFSTISTSGLTPGHVVTLWWAFFNNPRACTYSPCSPSDLNNPSVYGSLQYGGGYLVGANGRADFSGYLGLYDNTGSYQLFPNQPNAGLLYPRSAEIHLIIRTHGPASTDPAILNQQLSTFGGGCSASNPCSNIQAVVFKP